MTKFKCEDKVWVYVDPSSLNDASEIPVFCCTVEQVYVQQNYSYSKEITEEKINYDLSLGWDNLYRDESALFTTREEAIGSGLVKFKASISNLEKKLEIYKDIYTQMEQLID